MVGLAFFGCLFCALVGEPSSCEGGGLLKNSLLMVCLALLAAYSTFWVVGSKPGEGGGLLQNSVPMFSLAFFGCLFCALVGGPSSCEGGGLLKNSLLTVCLALNKIAYGLLGLCRLPILRLGWGTKSL